MKKLLAILVLLAFAQLEPAEADIAPDADFSSKCGTFRHLEQRRDPKSGDVIASEDDRPPTTDSYVSPSNKFKIHFDKAGKHGVDLIDLNQNSVPDYIDSVAYYFDFIYDIQVNQLGYHSPYPDNGKSGSGHYDIFVLDIGNGLDGEAYYGECRLDEAVLPPKKIPRYYSYIIIDNNYSEYDMKKMSDGRLVKTYSTTGMMALKVTAAHEFHHGVQFMYGIPGSGIYSVNEMISVYMENRCFPESLDFLQYVKAMYKDLRKYNFGNTDASNGYCFGIYYQFLSEVFGDETIRRHWELIEEGLFEFKSIDSALNEKGSSINASWNEFLAWVYHTGSRAIDGKYFYQAELFPELMQKNETYNIQKDESFDISGELQPYEIRPIRYIVKKEDIFNTPDTLDFLLSNTDNYTIFTPASFLSDFRLVSPSDSEPNKPVCDRYYSLTSDKSINDTAFCRLGYQSSETEKPYPSPFKLNSDIVLHFPAPPNVVYDTEVLLQIFSIENVEIWSGVKNVRAIFPNFKRVADLEPRSINLSSGVYLFRVSHGDNSIFGKFVVDR